MLRNASHRQRQLKAVEAAQQEAVVETRIIMTTNLKRNSITTERYQHR